MTQTADRSAASRELADTADETDDSWYTHDLEDIIDQLQTNPEHGLTAEEAARRVEQYGPNQLEEAPRPGFWRMVLDQFNNFIVLFLIGAAVVSALLGDVIEATAILAIVLLNAVLGVVQERRAEESLAALRKLAAPEAHGLRDGHRLTLPASELVPGDIVFLEAGNYVPADLRLVEAINLSIEEAALTGESVPAEKRIDLTPEPGTAVGERHNSAFMGTLVSYGRGAGVVASTGMSTQIGMIASMIQSVEDEVTPLQRKLDQLGKFLGWAAIAISGLVFALGFLRGIPVDEIFLVAVSLAVAAVPEGLPAVVTITLALGMREMIRRNALIRKLASVETLGSTTIICSDKTGTLTENQMTVRKIWVDETMIDVTGPGVAPVGQFIMDGSPVDLRKYPAITTALWVGALDNDALLEDDEPDEDGKSRGFRLVGDPTETALIVAAAKAGAWREPLESAYPRIDEIPFDSDRKRMTTVHKIEQPEAEDASPFYDDSRREWEVAATKGAPDVIVDLCTHYEGIDDNVRPMSADVRQTILAANESMASEALRVLAVAYRVERDVPDEATPEKVEHDLIFAGLIGMIDPPRAEVRDAIQNAASAGIRTMMITGDFPNTARAIAAQIGLLREGGEVRTGADLDAMDDRALRESMPTTDVFARVSPAHKMRIVDALQHSRQVVAMTGDGVNDAPALKKADIGVAMGITGTDVAKETADMVLTDDNYVSIVGAVEQGRVIYANIRKFVFYLLSSNVAEIAVILISILIGLPPPLTPIQLLWLNLVTDGAPALALGLEPGDPDTMKQPPRSPDEPIINRLMTLHIAVQTVVKAGATLAAYMIGLYLYPENIEIAKTMAFATLTFSELLRAFTSRSERYLLINIGLFTNKWMFLAVGTSLILSLAVIYIPFLQPIFDTVPLTAEQWRIILPLIALPAVVHEFTKWIILKWNARKLRLTN